MSNDRCVNNCPNYYFIISNPTTTALIPVFFTIQNGLNEFPASFSTGNTIDSLINITSTPTDYQKLANTSAINPLFGTLTGWIAGTAYAAAETQVSIYLAPSSIATLPNTLSLYINNPGTPLVLNPFPALILKFNGNNGTSGNNGNNGGQCNCNGIKPCKTHFFFLAYGSGLINTFNSGVVVYPPSLALTELRSLISSNNCSPGTKFNIYSAAAVDTSFPVTGPVITDAAYLGSAYITAPSVSATSSTSLTVTAIPTNGCAIAYPSFSIFVQVSDLPLQSVQFGPSNFLPPTNP